MFVQLSRRVLQRPHRNTETIFGPVLQRQRELGKKRGEGQFVDQVHGGQKDREEVD